MIYSTDSVSTKKGLLARLEMEMAPLELKLFFPRFFFF